MSSFVTSLSRTAIITIFSETLRQTCQHQLPQALAASLLKHIIIMPLQQALIHTTSCASPAITDALLTLPRLYQILSLQLSSSEVSSLLLLGKPPGNFGSNYFARNKLLARNSTNNTQRTTPKVLAPHQECFTAHRRSEGTNDSYSTSSDHQSWCVSHDFRPVTKSTLCKTSPMKTSILSHAYQVTIKLWWKILLQKLTFVYE